MPVLAPSTLTTDKGQRVPLRIEGLQSENAGRIL
jgi:hypothetical protein